MVQAVIKKILFNKFTATLLRNLILKLHNLSYKLSAIFSTILNDGVHPKHDIIHYEQWFTDNVGKHDIVLDIGANVGDTSILFSRLGAKRVIALEPQLEFFSRGKKNDTSLRCIVSFR